MIRANRFWVVLGTVLVGAALWQYWSLRRETAMNRVIESDEPIERQMAGGETHRYEIELEKDQFLHVVVEQQGIDVKVRLRDPDGEQLIEVDSPTGAWGTENLYEIAPASGRYRLEVETVEDDAEPGGYSLRRLPPRRATARDREYVAADHAFFDAKTLRKLEGRRAIRPALEKYHQALDGWRRLDEPKREMETLRRIGSDHESLGEFHAAITYYDACLSISRSLDDRVSQPEFLNRLGRVRLRTGELYRALEDFDQALALFREIDKVQGEALVLAGMGVAYKNLGQFQSALEHFEEALVKCRSVGHANIEATILMDLGPVYIALYQLREALSVYEEAQRIYDNRGEPRKVAIALNRIADAAVELEEFDVAISCLEQALTIFEREQDSRGRALALNTLGYARLKQGDFDQARRAFDEALSIVSQTGASQSEAVILLNAARLHVETGEPQQAFDLYERAFTVFQTVKDIRGQVSCRAGSARALRYLDRLPEARQRILAALNLVEVFRTLPERRNFRTSYFAFRQDYYEVALDVLISLDQQSSGDEFCAEAFAVNERRLARELLDTLASGRAVLETRADPELLKQRQSLEQELGKLVAAVDTRNPGEQIPELLVQHERLDAEIHNTNTAATPLEIQDVQQTLLDDESLALVYSLGDKQSYLWLVSRHQLIAQVLSPRRKIEHLAELFAELLPQRNQRALQRAASTAAQLSHSLLAPVAEHLGDRRLIIVTEGALQSIPFAALPEPFSEGADARPLIVSHEIVTLPSLSVAASLRRASAGRERPPKLIAAFADPVFERDDLRLRNRAQSPDLDTGSVHAGPDDLERSVDDLNLEKIGRLPHTRAEVEAILNLVDDQDSCHLALDFDANRSAVTDADLSQYRILHFATHALLNRSHPERSGLVFSRFDAQGNPQDGFLRAHEISALDLPVELVVLSACETGLGKDVRGEGLLSLSRGFLDAGATRVIFSLWRIGDRPTAELMERLYRAHLQDGLTPAAALRQAQLAMIQDPKRSAPYYWAGFVFQGDWE